jgi:tetratricopeptide (TPR) repeat protein
VLITFVIWGVMCVAFTASGIYPVGNIAHAAGFVLGVVIGLVVAPGSLPVRALAGGLLAALLAGGLAAAALWRPQVNLDPENAALDDAYFGSEALGDKRYDDAARLLRRSLALDPDRATTWYNYGIALSAGPDGSGLRPVDAWRRAFGLDPFDPQIRDAFFESTSPR